MVADPFGLRLHALDQTSRSRSRIYPSVDLVNDSQVNVSLNRVLTTCSPGPVPYSCLKSPPG